MQLKYCLFYQNVLQGGGFTLFTLQQTSLPSQPSPGKVSSDEGSELCSEVLLERPQLAPEGEAQ